MGTRTPGVPASAQPAAPALKRRVVLSALLLLVVTAAGWLAARLFGPHPAAVAADAWLGAWSRGDYRTMYRMADSAHQSQLSAEEYARAYVADWAKQLSAGRPVEWQLGRRSRAAFLWDDLQDAVWAARGWPEEPQGEVLLPVKIRSTTGAVWNTTVLLRDEGQWRVVILGAAWM